MEHFASVDDPRDVRRIAHPLAEILLLVVCATMADCDDYDHIAAWGEAHLAFLRRHLPFEHGVPGGRWLPGHRPFPVALDPFTCNRYEIAEFGRTCDALGIRYLGVCCGAGSHHIRALAEALGRKPPASRYSPDMSKHYVFGSTAGLRERNTRYAEELRGEV